MECGVCSTHSAFGVSADNESIIRYYPLCEEKIAEGKGTEVKSKEQETDTEQAAVSGETEEQGRAIR